MPNPKVTTRAANIWTVNLDRLTTTSEYEENVLLCVSPETRELILSLLHFQGYWPNRWRLDDASPLGSVDENTVIETVDKAVREVTLIMGCEGDLKRLADVVVDWYDSTHFDFFEFKALLEASGLEGIVNWIEALEEIGDLLEIVPDINVKMPVGSLVEMVMTTLYRRRQFAKWDDTNAMLQGLIMSDSGPSAPLIIDGIRALIPGNEIVDNILGDLDEQIQTIPAALITALLGNYMTNRTKDVADQTEAVKDAVEALVAPDLSGLEDAIGGISLSCPSCGSSGGCGCGCDGEIFDEGGLTDEDVENPGQDYLDDKCRVANVLHDRIRNFASTMDTIGVANILNLGVGFATSIIAGLVIAGPGGWATLLVIGVVSGILLLIVDLTAGQFGNLVTKLDSNQDDLVCALFSATSADGARDAYLAVLDAQSVGEPEQAIVAFMLTNSVTNQLFVPTGSYVEGSDWLNDGFTPTDCDGCGGDTLSYVEIGGIDCGTGDLTPDDISSRTLTATEFGDGIWRLQFRVDDPDRNVRMQIFDGSVGSVTTWPTSRLRCHPTAANIWITDSQNGDGGPVAVAGQTYIGGNFKVNGDGPFSLDVYIYDDFYDSVDCGEV